MTPTVIRAAILSAIAEAEDIEVDSAKPASFDYDITEKGLELKCWVTSDSMMEQIGMSVEPDEVIFFTNESLDEARIEGNEFTATSEAGEQHVVGLLCVSKLEIVTNDKAQCVGIERRSVACISTAHVPKSDAKILDDVLQGDFPILMLPFEYGWQFRTLSEEDYASHEAQFTALGLSSKLKGILTFFHAAGFDRVELERDAPKVKWLPAYEW